MFTQVYVDHVMMMVRYTRHFGDGIGHNYNPKLSVVRAAPPILTDTDRLMYVYTKKKDERCGS